MSKTLRKIKDPGSAITHFIGMLMACLAALPLLIKAATNPDKIHIISLSIFVLSLIGLYLASTLYHSLNINPKINKVLKKFDHMMISVLIAGPYTPICLIVLKGTVGWVLFSIIWGMAIGGIVLKALWVTCPKWVSSVVYIAMGWTCVLAFGPLINSLPKNGLLLLIAGGVIYTLGGIIYALKLPIFNSRHKYFGSHEIFHLFVMAGSFCHFLLMYQFVANFPLK